MTARDMSLAKSLASALSNPYYQAECLRVALTSCEATHKDEAQKLTDEILAITRKMTSEKEVSLCLADTSIALYRFDSEQSLRLAEQVENPAHRAFALAVMASECGGPDAQTKADGLLSDAYKAFSAVETPTSKAYAGYVLTRVCIGERFGVPNSIVDLSTFSAQPW